MSQRNSLNSKNSVTSYMGHGRPKKGTLRYSHAEILRGAKIPVSRLSAASLKVLPQVRKIVEKRLSRNRSSSDPHGDDSPFYRIDESWAIGHKEFRDQADISTHPSYNIEHFSYDLNCYLRYLESTDRYDRQFTRELENYINGRRTVYEQYFTRSFFSYTTLWPPLHTRREIDYFYKRFFQLTPKQKKRLNFLMRTDMSAAK